MLILSKDDPRAVEVIQAIRTGDVAGLQRLLASDPALAQARIVDRRGVSRTLLHVVADWPGHFVHGPQTVRVLVAAGADVNAVLQHAKPNDSAETPLHWAASSDDVGVLDALLDSGADIEAPGAVFTGGTPMSDAVVFANWHAARRLLACGAATTLWQAAALGLLDVVRQQASTLPAPTPQAITNAFWHACRGGHLAVAEDLLERGADPNWIGHDQKTPMTVALDSGATDLVQWLEGQVAAP